MIRFITSFYLALGLGRAAGGVQASAAADTPGAARQMLLKKVVPLSANSVETRVIRVQFPSGYTTPLHTHDGPGPRYVLKGRLRVEDAGKTQIYGPGDVFWETGAAMTVSSIGGGDAEIVIFELAPPPAAGQ
jgi:quercetin dioxygenase-like cupin family protein